MTNPVGRFEIAATDLKAVREFYSNLFDWQTSSDSPTKYALVDTGDGINGLIFRADPGVPTFVTFYIEVDDVEKYLEKAEQLGGTVYVPASPSPVPGESLFAVFGDPEGNIVGLRQRR